MYLCLGLIKSQNVINKYNPNESIVDTGRKYVIHTWLNYQQIEGEIRMVSNYMV